MQTRTNPRFVGGLLACAAGFVAVACTHSMGRPSPAESDAAGAPAEMDAGPAEFDGPFGVPTGTVLTAPLTGCAGPGYAASFGIGPQTFQLTIDTGSGTLAVASNTCADCGVMPVYAPGPNAVDQGKQVSDNYALGSWQGEVFSDAVELGGASMPVTLNIAAVTSQTAFLNTTGCGLGTVPYAPQGIAGFGPADLAVAPTDAFLPKFLQANAMPGVFGVELCSQGGQLMLGAIDPSAAALTGPAVYTPMTTSLYYRLELDDLLLGGTSLGFGAADLGATTADTGTSVLALPAPIFQSLVDAIEAKPGFLSAFGGRKGWFGGTTCLTSSYSSSQIDAMPPTLTLAFPGTDGSLKTLVQKPTQSYLPPTVSNGAIYYCSGIFQNPLSSGTIFGTSAMLGQMVIFDVDGQRLGFAPQKFCP